MKHYGKLPAIIDPRIPSLRSMMANPSNFVDEIPRWFEAVKLWPMLGNDKIGDCTIAALQHMVQLWTTVNGHEQMPDEACAIANYAHATGYDPATGLGDNGAAEIDILKYWMDTGMAIYADGSFDRLDGFAKIDVRDHLGILRAIKAFGCVYAGVEMPDTADTEFDQGVPWSQVIGQPKNGHAIPLVWGSLDGGYTSITWSKVQPMTQAWWNAYGSECYAPLRRSWVGPAGASPAGLTMDQLDNAITTLRGTLGLGAV